MPGARPRAVAPSSRRTSSPARIPDWEREEGKLHPWRDDILLSLNPPGGRVSSISLASSSTTHSVTGPAPRASMT